MPAHATLPRFWLAMLLFAATLPSSGCQWYQALRGDGLPESTSAIGAGVRGNDPSVQPSGFFTDRRSDQIERNLGGGF